MAAVAFGHALARLSHAGAVVARGERGAQLRVGAHDAIIRAMGDPQLTIEEAADRLGKPVSTVRRWVASGRLRGAKVGRQWLVDATAMPKPRPARAVAIPKVSAPPAVDIPTSVTQLGNRDLKALWVPDILDYEDALTNRVGLMASAAAKLAGPGPFEPLKVIEVPKSSYSTRPGADFALDDRLAYHAAVASMSPRIDRALSDAVYSARLSADPRWLHLNGRDQWLKWRRKTVQFIDDGYVWMVKTDIASYFDNVEHRLLFADIDRVAPEPAVATALKRMLSEWAPVTARGLPQGPDVSRSLGNLYLIPVDEEMLAGEWKYLRYLDDIHVLGRTRREAIQGLRTLERECRRRGLGLSGAKTRLVFGPQAKASLTDSVLDGAQYWFDKGVNAIARHQLRRILRGALSTSDDVNTRHALFSLYRLRLLRDRFVIKDVLANIEHLSPQATAMTQYLYPFLSSDRVQRGLLSYFNDPDRNTSPYVSAWLLAAFLDRGDKVPVAIVKYAAKTCRDRNQPGYHRVVAANVMALGRRPSDLAWLTINAKAEFDPLLVRGYIVALARVSELTTAVTSVVVARSPYMAPTLDYLRGRAGLPSLLFADHRSPVLGR